MSDTLTVDDAPVSTVPLSTVLGKAFTILASFDADHVDMTVTMISRRTGLAPSTIHRLSRQLFKLGMLEQTPNGGMRLGIGAFELGLRVPHRTTLRDTAAPFLLDLFDQAKHTVHLAMLEGQDIVILDKVAGHHALAVPSRVGGRLPAHCTALGKVMLAFGAARSGRPLDHWTLPSLTPRSITDVRVLRNQMVSIRETGVAVDDGEAVEGVACVSAPVLDANRRAVGAVSLSARREVCLTPGAAHAVRATAQAISQRLATTGRHRARTAATG